MALVLADRVLETTTSTGSGTITLAGAEPGYQSFSAIGNANQTYYTITTDTEWEVGIGTYTASGTTLSRDTVLASSNSGNRVTLPAGVKKVFVTYPSEKSVNLDVSGNISLSSAVISGVASPSIDSDAVNKLYVDTLVAQGITYHSPVKYEVPNTTGNLTATYNNGSSGVGATLTNAGTLAAFVPDGVTASISDRVLIYNQTNGFENGVYVVSTVGNGSTSWVLTRAADADTYALKSPNSLGGGDAFYVTSGNTGAGETYLCNNSGVISFGSTAISFVQISAAQVYQAGNGISLTNTIISLDTPVAIANGGTGTTATPTNGQLLIGNGSGYTLSTLTAGSGVSITNSAGSITLSATGLGGTVTAVTATGPLASSGGTTPDISIANATGTGSVVLDQGATISSATITAGVSAAITTITGSSANITTVSGTTARFSSAAITQLSSTSAGITTVSGTTTTFSSGTITQFGATSATITTLSGTSVSYPNANFTSATITNLALTSLTLANLSISSANITTLTGTNLSYASATITTGNLAFTGTAQRITGDMSNATQSSRLLFQTSTTNGTTNIGAIPNGTGTTAQLLLANSSDPTNASRARFNVGPSEAQINIDLVGTGTYLPMTFYTGGSERMRLDTSGNLGIGGSANATARLDLIGTSRNRFDVSTATVINTVTNAAANAYATLRIDSADYQFYTGGSEKVRIDSSGNVGIGTASPAAKLDIGSGNLTFSSTAQRITGDMSNATIGNRLAFQTSTTNGNTDLQIIPNGTSVTSGIRLNNNSDTTNAGYVRMSLNSTEASISVDRNSVSGTYLPLGFNTGGSERMRLDTSGNLGIGTTSPTQKLEIKTDTNKITQFMSGSGTAVQWQTINDAKTANVPLAISTSETYFFTGGTERLRIDSSGNVQIGNTSTLQSERLQVKGATLGGTAGNTSYNTVFYTPDTSNTTRLSVLDYRVSNGTSHTSSRNVIQRRVDSTDMGFVGFDSNYTSIGWGTTVAAVVNSSGNVGIGTTSPAYKLDLYSASGDVVAAVRSASAGAGILRLVGADATYAAYDAVISTQLNGSEHWYVGGNGVANTLVFKTNGGTERMRIDSSGNVGIGRTPSVTLDVNGPIYSRYTAGWGVAALYMPGGYSQFGKEAGYRTDIVNAGGLDSVGPFWTGYQWTPPDVITNSSGQNSFPRTSFYFNYSTVTNPSNMTWNMYVGNTNGVPISYNIGTESAGAINMITSGNTRMTVTSGGNVGIGTTSPGGRLHVNNSDSAETNPLLISNNIGGIAIATAGAQFLAHGVEFARIVGGQNQDNTFADGNLRFFTRNSETVAERVRITTSGGLGVGTTANPGAGAIYATGNITAYYSDARLKDFKGKIDGALNKVSQLNGYYYTENAKAEEYGYNNKATQVGVSAQEVQAVLPEVVSAAPFDLDEKGESKSGENYMTVNYEKLVPLLIEAIKELKAEVEALKASKS